MLKNSKLSVNPNLLGKSQYVLPAAPGARWRLDIGENLFPHHPALLEQKVIEPHLYPGTHKLLKKQISEYAGVSEEEIVLTAGSDSGLEIILRAIACKKITIPVPTFPQVFLFLELLGCEIDEKPITNPDDLLSLDLSNTDACYIVTPNLPLGYVVDPAIIETLLLKYPSVWFIIDEAYFEYDGLTSSHLLTKQKDLSFCLKDESFCLKDESLIENLIITRTFSKAFGLAGLRIGYFMAAKNVCELISPLVNNKSITKTAAHMASLALTHADFYLNNAKEVGFIRDRMSIELSKITGEGLPIYGFLIQKGLFLLLLSKTPQKVCDIFAAHGIMVRNKHDDYADSIRISIGPQHIMDDVLAVCEFINIKKLLLDGRIAFDLDLTLRDGSTPSALLYQGASIIAHVDSLIVTNNNCLVSDVVDYFGTYGIEVSPDNVVTSISSAQKYIETVGLKPYILGSPELFELFEKKLAKTFEKKDFKPLVKYSLEECTCVFLAWINITHRDIVDICHALSQGKPLLYTDMSEKCHTSCSSEFGEIEGIPSTMLPDMGLIIQMIGNVDPSFASRIKCIGKPNMDISCSVLVGDSISDYLQAARCDAKFIWIGEENRYNFDKKCFEVENINYLYQIMQ